MTLSGRSTSSLYKVFEHRLFPSIFDFHALPRRNGQIHVTETASNQGFRVRFRFWLQKKLSIDGPRENLSIHGNEIVLSPQDPDTSIADSEWLVMNAKGFVSLQDAKQFGQTLKAAAELSSVLARLGISSGIDKPTSAFGKAVKDKLKSEHGVILRDNVHGIDVFPDDPNVRIAAISASVTVRSAPNPFLSDIVELYDVVNTMTPRTV